MVGAVLNFSENDPGAITGTPYIQSPETDDDYRLRTATEIVLDMETFNYTAQNTGKHTYANTTMTNAWTTGNMTTNSGNITTITTGTSFGTYAYFPLVDASSTYCEMEAAISTQPTSNTVVDFGLFLRGAANPYAPTDGAYFRLTASGIQGVINYNGTETTTSTFTFTYTNNKKYQFTITCTTREVEFWIDNVLYATIDTPAGNGQPFASGSLPFSVRHAITGGAAGAALSFLLADYSVTVGGVSFSRTMSEMGNAAYGSYQGLSGGTMGTLGNYANSANPTAVVPTNTTAAAASTGLGGQTWETDTVAVTTDCIIFSYQNPAGTATFSGRRMKVNGVTIDSFVQTALTGGGYVAQWRLAFGHTAVSLATAEAATAKAPRSIALGIQTVASGATANAVLTRVSQTFQNPIYVNPGEFIAVVKKKVGTAPSAGTIAHVVCFDYGWE